MAKYNETCVRIGNETKTIKSGDAIMKDGIKYIFCWCTYQFERWIDTSRPSWCNQINIEGGLYCVDNLCS